MLGKSTRMGVSPGMDDLELSDFEIQSELGRGAFGRVFLAELPTTGKQYAIKGIRKDKIIDSQLIGSTRLEMDIMLKAKHPFLCGMDYFF